MIEMQACAACRRDNAPPFLFCEHCGAPRVRLGWLRMVANISLSMAAFAITHLMSEEIGWDWPVFSLYSFFLLQFMLALVSGRWRLTLKTCAWSFPFFILFLAIYTTLALNGADFFLQLAATVPEAAAEYPSIFFPALGALVTLGLLPFFFRWRRQFGWLYAYRIVLLALFSLAAVVLLGGRILETIHARQWLPAQEIFLAQFVNKAKPQLDRYVGFFALTAIRILIFEIFVTTALGSYHAAAHANLPDAQQRLGRETGFVRSVVMLGQVLRRFLLLIENMVHSLLDTLATLSRILWDVAAAFTRDVLLPAFALAGAGVLLYVLALWTRDYIAENTLSSVLRMSGAVAGLLVCVMVFLACVTSYPPGRIARFAVEFGGWLMPNLLVFFLLASLSLYLTGRVLSGSDPESNPLPFRVGPLTKADGVLLLTLLGIVLWKRRAMFEVQPGPPAPKPAKPKPEKAKAQKKTEAAESDGIGGGLLGRLTGRVQETVRESVREIAERAQGKPAVVEQLTRARRKVEEKAAQLRSLEKIRDTIKPEAYDDLWNQTRSELTFLEADRARLQTELDRQYGERLMEKATLEARLAGLNLESHEDSGAMSAEDRKQLSKTLAEIAALTQKLEACERAIVLLAPLAGRVKD